MTSESLFFSNARSFTELTAISSQAEDFFQYGFKLLSAKFGPSDEDQKIFKSLSKEISYGFEQAYKNVVFFEQLNNKKPVKRDSFLNILSCVEGAELIASICESIDCRILLIPSRFEFSESFSKTLGAYRYPVQCSLDEALYGATDSESSFDVIKLFKMSKLNYLRACSQHVFLEAALILARGPDRHKIELDIQPKIGFLKTNFMRTFMASASLIALNPTQFSQKEVEEAQQALAFCCESIFGHKFQRTSLAIMHHVSLDGVYPHRYLFSDEKNLRESVEQAILSMKESK